MISDCGTFTVKVLEFLYHHFWNQLCKKGNNIKGTGNFHNKIKNINAIQENTILSFGLLEALREALDKRKHIKWQNIY